MYEVVEKMLNKRKTCKLVGLTLCCFTAVTCYYGFSAWYEVNYGSLKEYNILGDNWFGIDNFRRSMVKTNAMNSVQPGHKGAPAETKQRQQSEHPNEALRYHAGNSTELYRGDASHPLAEHVLSKSIKTHPVVPNLVHFVWLLPAARTLQFTEMVSILSAFKVQKPDIIYFHCNHNPYGRWWDELEQKFNVNLSIKKIKISAELRNETRLSYKIAREFLKLDVLKQYGGIIMELDVIIINPLEDLRVHQFCIGQTTSNALSSSLILSAKNSSFVNSLYKSAEDSLAQKNVRSFDVLATAAKISSKSTDSVHVETETLTYPEHKQLLYNTENVRTVNWRKYYVICLQFLHGENKIYSPEYIKLLKNLMGQVLRYIYYGSSDVLDPYLPHILYSVPISKRH